MSSNIYQAPYYVPSTVSTELPASLQCEPGQIILFKDGNWGSESIIIDINSAEYPEGNFFSFSGSDIQDAATWIVFNLPKDVVCTLCDNVIHNDPNGDTPYDFSNAGVCVDLIGNGEIQTIDLVSYGANDCLSAGVWRKVKPSEGWFQLFVDRDQRGTFATIFLDEWVTGKDHSLSNWWLQDMASSVNYPGLTPPQLLTLSDNADGSGNKKVLGAANAIGKNRPATINLFSSGMEDNISSFSYDIISPVKVVIENVSVDISAQIQPSKTISATVNGKNKSPETIPITEKVAIGKTTSIENTTTLEFQAGASVTCSVEATEGIPDVDSVKSTLSATFSVSLSTESSNTTTKTNSIDLEQSITFKVPPETIYSADWNIAIGKIPSQTKIKVDGHFYYDQNLPGSILQDDGTYLLAMPITTIANGDIGSRTQFNVSTEKINNS